MSKEYLSAVPNRALTSFHIAESAFEIGDLFLPESVDMDPPSGKMGKSPTYIYELTTFSGPARTAYLLPTVALETVKTARKTSSNPSRSQSFSNTSALTIQPFRHRHLRDMALSVLQPRLLCARFKDSHIVQPLQATRSGGNYHIRCSRVAPRGLM